MRGIRTRLHRGVAIFLATALFTITGVPLAVFADSADQSSGTVAVPAVVTNATVSGNVSTPQDSPASAQTQQPANNAPTPAVSNADNQPSATLSATSSATPSGSLQNASEPGTSGSAPKTDVADTAKTPADNQNTASNTTSVNNNVTSDATSGKASVHDNGTAGNATTGNATADATVVNVVNSTTDFGGSNNYTYYTKDIGADETIQGNILIDPSSLTPIAGGSTAGNSGVQTTSTLTDILNNITLNAQTGNASVHDNGTGGNATSGDATAIANIINIVNSQIGAQRTFLGVINIYGNLQGNILVPSSFVDSLMGSANAPTASTTTGNKDTTQTTTTNIMNNVTANATSGNASVHDNGTAGDATSGDAMTNLTVYNLTGQQVIAKNSLLVFVNVMGKWVGMIVNQPGSTNAAFGGGVAGVGATSEAAGDSTTTTNITNNVILNAKSGNASVHDNTTGGNATTGNAKAGANILNIANTNFSMDDWFGVLFINVLGSWLGNFGIDNPVTNPADGTNPANGQPVVQAVKAFRINDDTSFTPEDQPASDSASTDGATSSAAPAATEVKDIKPVSAGKVLGASTVRDHAVVAKFDTVALVTVIVALALVLMLASWAARKKLANR